MSVTKSVKYYPLIASCSLNSTALIYSTPIDLRFADEMVLSAKVQGTPTGNFFLDGSINYAQGLPNPTQSSTGDWIAPTTSFAQALGTSALIGFPNPVPTTPPYNLNQIPYPWMRMRYVPTTGATSGVLDVWVGVKQL